MNFSILFTYFILINLLLCEIIILYSAINLRKSTIKGGFKIKKKKVFLLKINFKTIEEKDYKRILKKLLFIKQILSLNHFKIGLLEGSQKCIGYLINYDKNSNQHHDFILGINAILYKTRYERYNYIYDTICNYLDSFFMEKTCVILKIINVVKKEILIQQQVVADILK